MRVSCLVLALALGSGLGACAAEEEGTAVSRGAPTVLDEGGEAHIARVERDLRPMFAEREGRGPYTIEERMRRYNVPGVSIAVIEGGRIAWARGYGVAEAGTDRAVTPRTLFQAASISKPVAALVALRLVEEGRLALDEDVNGRLSGWRVPASSAANGRAVTLRGLLTHSAGLSVHGFPGYEAGEAVPTLRQVLNGEAPANSEPVRIVYEPGTEARYSGGGYTVMELLVEEVTGRPFQAVAAELVLAPLGMDGATFEQPLPEAQRARAAHAHGVRGAPVRGGWHTHPERAAAGLWATPTDIARYILEVHRAAAGEGLLLERGTARALLEAHLGGVGLGPAVDGEGDELRFEHGGSNVGFKAFMRGLAHRGQGVVVMTNGELGLSLIQEIVGAVAREYGWPSSAAPPGQAASEE